MAPYTNIPLSPAELSYLHSSLSQNPPIRPDGRSPTQFRPLVAETDILPSTNGSARICFADGTEAVVGVKAEVEKSKTSFVATGETTAEGVLGSGTGGGEDVAMDDDEEDGDQQTSKGSGEDSWLEISIEIPGVRDDDALPIFLSAMLREALLAEGGLKDRLWINRRFHWRLYVDVGYDIWEVRVILNITLMVSVILDLTTLTTTLISTSTAILDNTPCSHCDQASIIDFRKG